MALREYEAIVDATGRGDYTVVQTADDDLDGGAYRALVKNGPHGLLLARNVTLAALFAKDSPHIFFLEGFTYRLTEPADCVPSFKVSAPEDDPITFIDGLISAQEIELAGPTVLNLTVLVGTIAQIGVGGGPTASLALTNNSALSAVEIVVGSEVEGVISVAGGSLLKIDNTLGLLTIGREAVGALSVDPGGKVELGPSDVDLVIAEFSEASGSHIDVTGGTLIQLGTDESRPGKTIVGKGPGAKGTLSVLIGGKASLGDVTLGDKPGAEGTLSVLVGAELEAADITIGAQGRGTLEVGGSSKVQAALMFLGAEPDAEGTLTLAQESELIAVQITIGAKGRGTLEISDSSTVEILNALLMGTDARGDLLIESGARLEVADVSSVAFGDNGEATARVVGKSSLWKTGVLLVGPNGVLAIKKEGRVESTDAQLTGNFDDFAVAEVLGGSNWFVSGTLRVGDNEVEGLRDVEKTSFLEVSNESSLTCDTVVIGQHGSAKVKGVLIRDPGTFSFGTEKGLLRAQAASEPVFGLTTRRLIIKEGGELIAETITLGPGGELSGDGAANLDIISEGTIDPGGEEGETAEFTINGDLTLEADSEVQVDIGGLIPGEEYDVLIVNGHCQLGGKLKINLVNGYIPNVGDRFEVLRYESREGEYDTIDSDGTGVYFTPELANGRLTLIAAAVDESGRLSPEELADLALMQGACAPGCGPMGLMPLGLTLLGICGLRAGVKRGTGGC